MSQEQDAKWQKRPHDTHLLRTQRHGRIMKQLDKWAQNVFGCDWCTAISNHITDHDSGPSGCFCELLMSQLLPEDHPYYYHGKF